MSIRATQQRDEPGIQQFQAFYENNLVSVYRCVFQSLRNREEAEDLASQIFLKALRYHDSERGAQSARSWLFQIARTTIADYWRTYYRMPTSSLELQWEGGWEGPTEEDMLETNERAAERVRNLLQALPERYREVLRCRFLLNLSIRETAATMGISKANVKTPAGQLFLRGRCSSAFVDDLKVDEGLHASPVFPNANITCCSPLPSNPKIG